MQIEAGWLPGARRVPSPNCDRRPADEVSLLVLHAISLPPGEFGGDAIERLFTNRLAPEGHAFFAELEGLRVSAHLLIRRDGECVQFVPFHERAWHAGRSRWHDGLRERQALNDFAVGIELEGDEATPFSAAQYRSLAKATASLLVAYPALTEERITSHARIAPLRKRDPGPTFDWAFFRQDLEKLRLLGSVDQLNRLS